MVDQARQLLSDDHEAVYEVLQQLVTALNKKDVQTSHAKLDLLWARLAVHIRAEHLHLFPAIASKSSEAQSIIDKLRADHDFFMRKLAQAIGVLRELPTNLDNASDDATWASVSDAVAFGAIVFRYAIWLQRPATRVYWRRGWTLYLQREKFVQNTTNAAKTLATNLVGQRFIFKRGFSRWAMHFLIMWGSVLSALITFPRDRGAIALQQLTLDFVPNMLLIAISVTGLRLTASSLWLNNTTHNTGAWPFRLGCTPCARSNCLTRSTSATDGHSCYFVYLALAGWIAASVGLIASLVRNAAR
jgi:Hemerythrin HHE cation binding domain